MYLLTMLGVMMFSHFSTYADEGDDPIASTEEISSADSEVLVNEDCGCGKRKKT